ncbi:hypothetical protein HQ560_03955 [bacterium]|nr:hypothetical protein [bacterium]
MTTSRYLPGARQFAARQNQRLVLADSREVAEWCRQIAGKRPLASCRSDLCPPGWSVKTTCESLKPLLRMWAGCLCPAESQVVPACQEWGSGCELSSFSASPEGQHQPCRERHRGLE